MPWTVSLRPAQRGSRVDRSREPSEVVLAEITDVLLVLAVAEQRRVGLDHAVDNRDLRTTEATLGELTRGAVLEEAEQPIVAAPGPITRIS